MQSVLRLLSAIAAAGLLPEALGSPVPQMSYGENSFPQAAVTALPTTTATAASGSLYGPASLLGEVAQPSPISGGDSAIVSSYPKVNGQDADAQLGLYLDFNSVENPQPIRGANGNTDPGPSECPWSYCMC